MKKLIPFLMLLAGVAGAHAQGVVLFANQVLPEPPDRTVYDLDMVTPLTGTHYRAQLWYGSTADSLQAHTQTANFRAPGTTYPGTWSSASRTLTGAGGVGTTIFLQVRAWDSRLGATYAEARARGTGFGESAVFTYVERFTPPSGAPDDKWMVNFTGFSLVPEPSVIGLGLIGVGALFLLRRRKA